MKSYLPLLSAKELQEVESHIIRILCETPTGFAGVASEGKWKPAKHLLAIEREVLAIINGERREQVLVIEAPPRHGKSEFISKHLPAWFVGRNPDYRVILASYESNIARSWGRKTRDLIADWGSMCFGVSTSKTQWAAAQWDVEGRLGGMTTAGIGGPITGRGANLLIVDDYLKNAEDATSEVVRANQWDWWQSTARTRLEPGGVAIVMATRWHQDDLIGRLKKAAASGEGEPIREVRLPAIAEDDDWIGRANGEPLWPSRWPLEELRRIETSLDLYWWLALYQQRPSQHGKAEWPGEYFEDHIWADTWPDTFEVSAMAIDPSKGKSDRRGDYSAIVFMGLAAGRLWVESSIARRPVEQIIRDAVDMWIEHRPTGTALEANQFQDLLGPQFTAECEARNLPPIPVYLINNTISKAVRIRRLGPLWRSRVISCRHSPGNRVLISQSKEFGIGDHDDGPDAMEMAYRLLCDLVGQPQQIDQTETEIVGV